MAKKSKPAVDEDEDLDLEDEDAEDETETDDDEEEEEAESEDSDDEEDDDAEAAPKAKKKGGAKKGGLVPREPVKVSSDVLKAQPKEIRTLLKQRDELIAKGDKKGLRKLRAALRTKGFRLSDLSKAS